MTTAERDVETAREALDAIYDGLLVLKTRAANPCPFEILLERTRAALNSLAALNGEAGEEWEAAIDTGCIGDWAVWRAVGGGRRRVVGATNETTARRIARLPKLERAANDAIGPLEYAYRNVSSPTADKVKQQVLPALRSALAGEQGR